MSDPILARAAEIAASTRNCVLALIDADGYPTAATITPSKTDGIERVYFGNNRGSNWVKRAANCDRAGICFTSDRPENNITLVGTIEVVGGDPDLKKEMWRGWMEEYYTGPEDARFVVLRFTTRRYSLYVDGTQARGRM